MLLRKGKTFRQIPCFVELCAMAIKMECGNKRKMVYIYLETKDHLEFENGILNHNGNLIFI